MASPRPDDLKEVIRDFRRDQVVDVATRLFGERGTTEVSMDEIASRAGVARSTIYVYFSNRDELVRACITRMHDQLVAAVTATWDTTRAPVDRLRALILGLFEQIDANPAFVRLALSTYEDMAPSGAVIGSEVSVIGLDVVGRVRELYRDGVDGGEFRAFDPDRAVALIGEHIYWAMSVRAADPLPRPRDGAAAEIAEFLLRGLAADRRPIDQTTGSEATPNRS
ncbi:MAG: TetR/AcrR family transcriptional regulator [Acidimicrobiales bacterium]